MRRKSKVQAMPGKKAAGVAQDDQGNPGQAGQKGALAERAGARGGVPSSGPRGNEGNNTRRDFVRREKKSKG